MSCFSIWFSFRNITSSSKIIMFVLPPSGTSSVSGLAPLSKEEKLFPLLSVHTPLASLGKRSGAHHERLILLVGLDFMALVSSDKNVGYLSWLVSYKKLVLMVQTSGLILGLRISFCCTHNCVPRCIYPYSSSRGSLFLSNSLACPSRL